MKTFMNIILTVILLALLNLCNAQTRGCTIQKQQDTIAGIYNVVDEIIGASLRTLTAYANQAKYFGDTMEGSPNSINDPTMKQQTSLYNIFGLHRQVYVYAGWEDDGFVGFFEENNAHYISYQNRSNPLLNFYSYNSDTGLSEGSSQRSEPYQCTKRPWYAKAKDQCPPDKNNYFSCASVLTPLYESILDNELTFTPSLGFPNWKGKPRFEFNQDIYPYGGQGVGASSFSGVVAADIPTSIFSDMLANSVATSSITVSYIMEETFNLVSTSDGSSVSSGTGENFVRVPATQSTSPLIAETSDYIIKNKYLSDNTVLWEGKAITVRKYYANSVQWLIIVVSTYHPDELECDFEIEAAVLTDILYETNSLLGAAVNAGEFLLGGINYNLYRNPLTPPVTSDLWKLGGSNQEVNVQNMLIAAGLTFPEATWIFVGFEDNTFVGYSMNNGPMGENSDATAMFDAFLFQDGSLPGNTVRNSYYTESHTGYAENPNWSGAKSSYTPYICSKRPWYAEAKAEGKAIWSAPYIFADEFAQIGFTYSLPFYDANNNLVGVIGIDFVLSVVQKVLEKFSSSGKVYYAFETALSPINDDKGSSQYDLLMSSSQANVVNEGGTAQVKAWDQQSVGDFMISNSAKYMDETSFVYNGQFATGDLECSVRNFRNYGLYWRFVGTSYNYQSSANNNNNNGDNNSDSNQVSDSMIGTYPIDIIGVMNHNMGIITATLCLVIFQLIITLTVFNRLKAAQVVVSPAAKGGARSMNNTGVKQMGSADIIIDNIPSTQNPIIHGKNKSPGSVGLMKKQLSRVNGVPNEGQTGKVFDFEL